MEPSQAQSPPDSDALSETVYDEDGIILNPTDDQMVAFEMPKVLLHEAKGRFFDVWDHDVDQLERRISKIGASSSAMADPQAELQACQITLADLSRRTQDAVAWGAPAYDLRKAADAVRKVGEKLAATRKQVLASGSGGAKKKFAFKTRLGAGSSAAESSKGPHAGGSSVADESAKPPGRDGEARARTFAVTRHREDELVQEHATSVKIDGKRMRHIILQATATQAVTTAAVSDNVACYIDLSPPTSAASFASVRIRDIKGSVVVVGRVAGPVHVTSMNGCVLAVSCHQLRMHNCEDVDVYVHCGSRPIIEECESMNFAPLPDGLVAAADSEANNQWDQVDDFNWLRPEPSPNWSILPVDARISNETWGLVGQKVNGMDTEQLLQAFGIKNDK